MDGLATCFAERLAGAQVDFRSDRDYHPAVVALSGRPSPRVHEHLERLRAAGLDTQAFFEALVLVRDDSALPEAHREAIYRCVAMECYIWYLEALLGEPIDRIRAMTEARALAEERAAAIRRTAPGEVSAELLRRDLRRKPPEAPSPANPEAGPAFEPRLGGAPRTGSARGTPPDARPRGPRGPRRPR